MKWNLVGVLVFAGMLCACAAPGPGPSSNSAPGTSVGTTSSKASPADALRKAISFKTEDYQSWNNYFADRPSSHPTISGLLMYPRGQGPVPAVVLISGGKGIESDSRYIAQNLVDAGFAVFMVDQATGRGLSPKYNRYALVQLGVPSRLADGMNALRVLVKQSRIEPKHIGIFGISLGGEDVIGLESTVLQGPYAKLGLRYAAHAAIYPVCGFTSDGPGTTTGAPMLLMTGGKDYSDPVGMCRAIVNLRRQTNTKSDIRIVVYPNARHSWDRTDIIGTPYVSGKINLAGCPIVSMRSAHDFVVYRGGTVHRLPNDHAFYSVFRRCWHKGDWVGYSATASRESTTALIAFFRKHLME